MTRILKIDNFVKDFPTKYGLDADGSYYEIKEPFEIMIIVNYEDISNQGEIKYKTPKWQKIQVREGDFISCSKNGAFFIPKEKDGFVECTPCKESKQQDISFDTFPKNSLKKIGKDLFKLHPMSFDEREKITISKEL